MNLIQMKFGAEFSEVADIVCWSLELYGVYSVKSGYSWLLHGLIRFPLYDWSWCFKLKIPEKIMVLLWQISHWTLPTNVLRYERSLALSPDCVSCFGQTETMMHCLSDCGKAARVWEALSFGHYPFFYMTNVKDWFFSFWLFELGCAFFSDYLVDLACLRCREF